MWTINNFNFLFEKIWKAAYLRKVRKQCANSILHFFRRCWFLLVFLSTLEKVSSRLGASRAFRFFLSTRISIHRFVHRDFHRFNTLIFLCCGVSRLTRALIFRLRSGICQRTEIAAFPLSRRSHASIFWLSSLFRPRRFSPSLSSVPQRFLISLYTLLYVLATRRVMSHRGITHVAIASWPYRRARRNIAQLRNGLAAPTFRGVVKPERERKRKERDNF